MAVNSFALMLGVYRQCHGIVHPDRNWIERRNKRFSHNTFGAALKLQVRMLLLILIAIALRVGVVVFAFLVIG